MPACLTHGPQEYPHTRAFLHLSRHMSCPCGFFLTVNWGAVGQAGWNRKRGLRYVMLVFGLGSVLCLSNPYGMLLLNGLKKSMAQKQARGLMRALGLMGD